MESEMKPKIVFSEKCLEYYWPGHPESPERVRKAYEILKELGYEFLRPKPASEEDLLKVHTEGYIEKLKAGKVYDGDTPPYEDVYEYARLAAGAAVLAAKERGFSLMRPPGHHAGRNGRALGAPTLGFCYLNNVAIAVRSLDVPTLILDIDGHHGNGTQEIFWGDPKVTFISLHRDGLFFYPGTGGTSEGNCLNFPFATPPGDELYLKTLDKALEKANLKRVELVAVSAGFDAHKGDLASLDLSSRCYREIGRRVAKLGVPAFGVLEGGYVGENVGKDIHELLSGLSE